MSSDKSIPSIYDLGTYRQLCVDMGSSTTLDVHFSCPAEHLQQIWLASHQITASDDSLLRVEIRGPTSLRQQSCITNQLGGPCIFLQGAIGATLNVQQSMPWPLLEASNYRVGSQDLTFQILVTKADGTPVTYTRLVLFFALTSADPEKRWAYPTLSQVPHGFMGTRTY